MKRRAFLTLLGGATVAPALLCPPAARAQRARRTPTVGVLMAGSESAPDNQARIAAFRRGLADLGWRDGENVRIEYRWSAGRSELIHQYAAELVALAPDVILANSTPVISAFKSLTTSVPVVFALDMDPVGLGHVQSLAHPGGNFTGFTFVDPDLIGKWMGLLKDVVPTLTQAAVLFDPATSPAYDKFVREIEFERQSGAVEPIVMPVASTEEMEAAIDALAKRPGSGLMIGPDPFNQVRLKQIAQLAAQRRLPTISVYRPFVVRGASWPMDPIRPTSSAVRLRTWTACSRERIRPTCRCNGRTSSNSSSISRPPRHSASTSRRRCSRSPTR